MELVPHPDMPPVEVTSIGVNCWQDGERWHFRYLVEGAGRLVLPDPVEPGRADNLWRTTCFEAFVGGEGTAYREYNFAASGEWAAFDFDGPRAGLSDADDSVEVWLEGGDGWIAVEAAVSATLAPGSPLGLSAVIEEVGGVKSYWALAHPEGPPDFHNRDCFKARLTPVGQP